MARYDRGYGAGRRGYGSDYPTGGSGGGGRYGARGEYRYGSAEMQSNDYSRRLRGGWQRGFDGVPRPGMDRSRGARAAPEYGREYPPRPLGRDYGSDFLTNRASAEYGEDYYRSGPTYGLRDARFTRRYGR